MYIVAVVIAGYDCCFDVHCNGFLFTMYDGFLNDQDSLHLSVVHEDLM